MIHPYTPALRQLRRSAGLTQDDVARILGKGGRSYVAMLESGDRVPHVRDTIILSMLFGTEEVKVFPHLHSITRETFRSNVLSAVEAAMTEKEPDQERLRFLRDALTSAEIIGNVAPSDV